MASFAFFVCWEGARDEDELWWLWRVEYHQGYQYKEPLLSVPMIEQNHEVI